MQEERRQKLFLNFENSLIRKNSIYKNNYSSLYKIINRNSNFLLNLLRDTKNLNLDTRMGYETCFFASARELARKYNKSPKMTNKYLNLYCVLGLLKKLSTEDLEENNFLLLKNMNENRGLKKKLINIYSWFMLSPETLIRANERASILLDNHYSIRKLSKRYIASVFGIDFANDIYPDTELKAGYEGNNFNYDIDKAIDFLERRVKGLVDNNGYATREEVRQFLKTVLSEHEEKELKEKSLMDTFDINLNRILKDNDLAYVRANKELKEKYNLKSYIYIIVNEIDLPKEKHSKSYIKNHTEDLTCPICNKELILDKNFNKRDYVKPKIICRDCKDNKARYIYAYYDYKGNLIYIGSTVDRSRITRECNHKGYSKVYYADVYNLVNLQEEDLRIIEHELIRDLKPKFNTLKNYKGLKIKQKYLLLLQDLKDHIQKSRRYKSQELEYLKTSLIFDYRAYKRD